MLQDYLNLMIETNFSICKIIYIIKKFKLKTIKNVKQEFKIKMKKENKNKNRKRQKMINIYDDVNNLVSNLKKHELTVNFKEIRKKLKEENEELFKKIEEFQKLNIEINTKMLMEGNVEEEKQNKSKEMYDELVKEPLVLEYFEKELALNKMLEDVNSIFMNGVRDIYSEEGQIKEYIYNNLITVIICIL